jgi:hypothetical protein
VGWNSSVCTSSRYGLDGPGIDPRWGARFSAPFQIGPGAHPSSYAMGTWSFLGVKRPERDVDHPPPSRAEVKERLELYLYSSSYPSWPVLLFCKKKKKRCGRWLCAYFFLYSSTHNEMHNFILSDGTVTDAPICEVEGTLHKYLSEIMIYCTSLCGRGLFRYCE